jgi:L-ascorbate metabolism protein UlaG (beta-lactamase superfamily)
MKLKWFGHACFLVTSDSGIKIILDPFASTGGLKYGELKETADIVTISHEHFDHNNIAAIKGKPEIIKGAANKTIKGIPFKGIPTFHDEDRGKKRGNNVIYRFEVDGITLCHTGDLGHDLTARDISEIGNLDILMLPVGGYYTIDAKVATEVCNKLKPKIILPMHYKNEKIDLPIVGVEDFLKGKKNVSKVDASEVQYNKNMLPASTQIIILKPAL